MEIEDQLRERLRKVEALFFGAATLGEREAACAAAERLKAKLDEAIRWDPPVELKFTMPDQWSCKCSSRFAAAMGSNRSVMRASATRR